MEYLETPREKIMREIVGEARKLVRVGFTLPEKVHYTDLYVGERLRYAVGKLDQLESEGW